MISILFLILERGAWDDNGLGKAPKGASPRTREQGFGERTESAAPQMAFKRKRESRPPSHDDSSARGALQAVNERGDYAPFRALLRSQPDNRTELLSNLLRIGKSPKGNEFDHGQKLELLREFDDKNVAGLQRLLNESLGKNLDIALDYELVGKLSEKDWEAVVTAAATNNPGNLFDRNTIKVLPREKARTAWTIGIWTWLSLDSMEASKAVIALPNGPEKLWATESVIKWLRDKGDNQAADEWQSQIPPK